MFWDIDGFVWLLHGGAILLGLPAVLCVQKLNFGTEGAGPRKRIFENCPTWMRKMIGAFVVYGIINFIFFMSKGDAPKGGGSTPASVFKGFSGHWMIFYSVEMAVFYSCLKMKVTDVSTSLFAHQIGSISPSSLEPRKHRSLLIYFLWLFVVALVLSLVFLFARENFFFLFIFGFISVWVMGVLFFIISAVYLIASQIYLFKHHRQLWKAAYRGSFSERMQAAKTIRSLNDPFLAKAASWWNKAQRFLLRLWLVVFSFVVVGYLLWNYFWRAA